MRKNKMLSLIFGSAVGAGAVIVGGGLTFGQINQEKMFECSPANASVSARVVKWRLTGGYGLGIINATDQVSYAENSDRLEPLIEKAEQFCRTRQIQMSIVK